MNVISPSMGNATSYNRPLPRPSIFLIVLSVITIVAVLLFICLLIAGLIVEPNFFVLLPSPFIILFGVVLVVQLYRGVFCRVASAASCAGVQMYVSGGSLLAMAVGGTGEALYGGTVDLLMESSLMSLFIVFFILAACCLTVARTTQLWGRKLRKAGRYHPDLIARKGSLPRKVLACCGVLAVMFATTAILVYTSPPRYGEHVDGSAAPIYLPKGATDVSFARGNRGCVAYEFTIDEPAFRTWVESGIGTFESRCAGIFIREIEEPFTIYRYGINIRGADAPSEITVSEGLYYSWSKEDRGVHAVFDRTTNRAYYDFHSY